MSTDLSLPKDDLSRIVRRLDLPPLTILEADGAVEIQAGDLLRVHTKSVQQSDGTVRTAFGVKVE